MPVKPGSGPDPKGDAASGRRPSKAGQPSSKPKKPGRPKGSIKKLKAEDRAVLLSAVEGGATDHAAAKAMKVHPRTFKRWREIAEGDQAHPEKAYLIDLFTDIDAAEGRARIRREIDVAAHQPLPWLKNQARSKPGLPGWTPPVPDEAEEDAASVYAPTPEEMAETIRILISSGAVPDPFEKERSDGEAEEHSDKEQGA